MLQKLKKRLKNQKGFTLIELLAVIVILGIIAAIAVPAIGKIIQNSREDAVIAEGIQIISAAKLYRATDPDLADMTETQLGDLVENVDEDNITDDTNGYSVHYEGGVYSITGHKSVELVTTADTADPIYATEKELIAGRK